VNLSLVGGQYFPAIRAGDCMRKIGLLWMLIGVILAIGTGCAKEEIEPDQTTKQLQNFYPGDITNVTLVKIRSGETGELRTLSDKDKVRQWIETIKSMEFVPDPNQEGRAGFLYSVSLYEGEALKLGFTNNTMGKHYYLNNEQLLEQIRMQFKELEGS